MKYRYHFLYILLQCNILYRASYFSLIFFYVSRPHFLVSNEASNFHLTALASSMESHLSMQHDRRHGYPVPAEFAARMVWRCRQRREGTGTGSGTWTRLITHCPQAHESYMAYVSLSS
jgi:hypothetical protein